jgi:PmbA protein
MTLEEILRKAEKVADEAEVYYYTGGDLLARSTLDKIETCKSLDIKGYGVRLVKGNKIGFSYASRFSDSDKVIDTALKAARLSDREVRRFTFPGRGKIKKVKNYDGRLERLTEEDLVELLLKMVDGSKDRGANPMKGEISAVHSEVRVMNSGGVDVEEKETMFTAFVISKKKEATGYDFVMKKRMEGDMLELGKSAAAWADKAVGGKPVTFEGDVILDVECLSDLLGAILVPSINGERVRRNKSVWSDRLQQKVVSEKITLTDNPLLDYGVGTSSFDDEGTPSKEKVVIEKGVLKQFLYDQRTAKYASTQSTGNGFRTSFSSPPAIGTTNMVLRPAERENVFATKKGIYVKELMGFHNANIDTGDFALDIVCGFEVSDGEVGKPVRGCMLVGNAYDILKQDELAFDREGHFKTWLYSPHVRFAGKVVGTSPST